LARLQATAQSIQKDEWKSQHVIHVLRDPIRVDVYAPESSGQHAVVLVVLSFSSSTALWLEPPFGADIVSFAEALNKKGMAATIPHYFESTKTSAG
jgi:hypothetical protein